MFTVGIPEMTNAFVIFTSAWPISLAEASFSSCGGCRNNFASVELKYPTNTFTGFAFVNVSVVPASICLAFDNFIPFNAFYSSAKSFR